jgi:leucyl-tRNA synthetase
VPAASVGAAASGAGGEAPKSFVRRDRLVQIAQDMQKKWDDTKLNEVDAGSDLEPKYMASFPYPYMNGRLHLGHAFTISKAEFAVRYQRLQGKRALFPYGFHCTGMPIQAAANKLKRELNPVSEAPIAEAAAVSAPVLKAPGKFSSKKSKSVAKGSGATTSFILKASGVEEADIPKFQVRKAWCDISCQSPAHLSLPPRRTLFTGWSISPLLASLICA